VTNAEYRSWGALKKIDYVNSNGMTMNYNNRLQAQEYSFVAVNPYPGSTTTTQMTYDYYDDGRLKKSDVNWVGTGWNFAPNFDRLYEYDFVGRLKTAKTGAEARGQVETNPYNRPYRLDLTYNHFGEIINQQRLHWAATFNSTFQYQNNRLSVETKS